MTTLHTCHECPDVLLSTPGNKEILTLLTYELHKESGRKAGSVSLLHASRTSLGPVSPPIPTRAVFDGRWSPLNGTHPPYLLTATHGPGVSVFALEGGDQEDTPLHLRPLYGPISPLLPHPSGDGQGEEGQEEAGSALCCAWLGKDRILCGLSDGWIWVGSLDTQGGGHAPQEECRWKAHSLHGTPMEVWCASVVGDADSSSSSSWVWSGGDDGCIRAWDVRDAPPSPSTPPLLSRAHTAGVTCIVPHPNPATHLIATGSYDERLLLWDARFTHPKKPLAEVAMGGGVWRVSWGTQVGKPFSLAAACMYGGARVVTWGEGMEMDTTSSATTTDTTLFSEGWQVTGQFTGHESKALTYGVEWLEEDLVATCAFYSKEVALWSPSSAT